MRKIGEQWIEEIEGVRHLLKVIGNEHNATCMGCSFSYWNDPYEAVTCFFEDEVGSCPVCQRGGFAVRDLGPVNEKGVLGCPFSGKYPHIENFLSMEGKEESRVWCVVCAGRVYACTKLYNTEQEAIDAWNRRKS